MGHKTSLLHELKILFYYYAYQVSQQNSFAYFIKYVVDWAAEMDTIVQCTFVMLK